MRAKFVDLLPPAGQRGRYTRLLTAAALTGVLVALLVAVVETLAEKLLLHELETQPLWLIALAPGVGLLIASALLRYGAPGATASTSDEYVRAYHSRRPDLPLRHLPAKLMAGVATIGFGGSLGLEGPAIYAGSTVGHNLQERLSRFFRRDEVKMLLTAGAAAGVAAVFKAPATGLIFALEAPYRDDVTQRALLPGLLASVTGYVTYVSIIGTKPVVPFIGQNFTDGLVGIDYSDIAGAVLLGIGAGLAARGVVFLVRRTKALTETVDLKTRLAVAFIALAGLTWLSDAVFDEPLTIGPGFSAMGWVIEQDGLGLIALLAGCKIGATLFTLLGGGVGGLFIPLATLGVISGQFVGVALDESKATLYPTLGLAAFLGAGYRAPLTAVMFVAESTGGGGFVVPALIAAAFSQVVTGRDSVSGYQVAERLGHLESRLALPLTSALSTDVMTVPPDATVAEFMYLHVLGRRQTNVPVVDGAKFIGIVRLANLDDVDRSAWETTTIIDVCETELPVARPGWTLRDAATAMEQADMELLAVADQDENFVGVVREDELVRLDEILDQTS